ncbi:hypothetical protein bcgnr5378_06790 [Bacillus cereus]|uniref:Uncharacterized protein n=1 Tax=Bacillus cereus TaxID=1396 RepID=A0A164NWK7_BACCE|nr:hypothetical protein [Bacillus cereus]KZD65937.1 hypothetical protein B4088_2694 [Bacillus cereus]
MIELGNKTLELDEIIKVNGVVGTPYPVWKNNYELDGYCLQVLHTRYHEVFTHYEIPTYEEKLEYIKSFLQPDEICNVYQFDKYIVIKHVSADIEEPSENDYKYSTYFNFKSYITYSSFEEAVIGVCSYGLSDEYNDNSKAVKVLNKTMSEILDPKFVTTVEIINPTTRELQQGENVEPKNEVVTSRSCNDSSTSNLQQEKNAEINEVIQTTNSSSLESEYVEEYKNNKEVFATREVTGDEAVAFAKAGVKLWNKDLSGFHTYERYYGEMKVFYNSADETEKLLTLGTLEIISARVWKVEEGN